MRSSFLKKRRPHIDELWWWLRKYAAEFGDQIPFQDAETEERMKRLGDLALADDTPNSLRMILSIWIAQLIKERHERIPGRELAKLLHCPETAARKRASEARKLLRAAEARAGVTSYPDPWDRSRSAPPVGTLGRPPSTSPELPLD